MAQDVSGLLRLLDLETIDDNLFRGICLPSPRTRVFGGQAVAQALVAATRTVDPVFGVHSLHSYFLQPGDPGAPIVYDVENLRDGRSFVTRRVLGRQHGRPIYALTASFQRVEGGYEHQDAMPQVPRPEDGVDLRSPALAGDPRVSPNLGNPEWGLVDLSYVGSTADDLPAEDGSPGRQRLWLRVAEELPADPLLHVAAFAYLSDLSLVGAALAPHGLRLGGPESMVASLDHAVWFHRPFRVDDWWLYDQHSPSAGGGRGLVLAEVHTPDGTLVATVAQEALMRRVDPDRVRR